MSGDNTEKAAEILKRVEAESVSIGDSAMLKSADANKLGKGEASDDPIEVIGTRIGRALGAIAFVGLAIYLLFTYVLPG